MTVKEERKIHRLSDTLGIGSDGSMNIQLFEWYETSSGVGRNAEKTGEFAWRPRNGGSYHSTLNSVAHSLLKSDVVEAVGEVGLNFDEFKSYIDAKLDEYKSFLKDNITLELAKVKGATDEEVPVTTNKVKRNIK